MNETVDPYLRTLDAITPESMAEELGRQGVLVSADYLRQTALEIGACHILGDALFLLPEDVEALLRHGKQHPSLAKRSARSSGPAALRQNAGFDDQEPIQVYTPATVAKRWGCSERHIRNMIATGELPSFRAGGKLLRIRVEDVRAAELAGNLQMVSLPSSVFPPTQPVAARVKKRKKPAQRLDQRY